MSYTLNTEAAKQADNKFSRIDSSGKYVGVFTRAEKVTSKSGAKGIDFSFKSDDGEQADYLSLWTHNKEGKELQGFKTLMAIMTCLKLKTIDATEGEVEKYNSASQQREKVRVELFQSMMNTPVGLLIQIEEQEYNGNIQRRTNIYAPFTPDGFTASEVLDKAVKPEKLEKMLAGLKDKLLTHKPAQQPSQAQTGNAMDDDFPF